MKNLPPPVIDVESELIDKPERAEPYLWLLYLSVGASLGIISVFLGELGLIALFVFILVLAHKEVFA